MSLTEINFAVEAFIENGTFVDNRTTVDNATLIKTAELFKKFVIESLMNGLKSFSENTTLSVKLEILENQTELSSSRSEWSNKQIFLTILLGAITAVTILANIFVLYIFATAKRKLRTSTHLLLANLAVADLFVGILVMPILSTTTILNLKWVFGDFICASWDYLHFTLCATSMFSMIGVSVERYIGVKYPLKHKQFLTKRRVVILIIVIWISSAVLVSFPLTYWPVSPSGIKYVCLPNIRVEVTRFVSIVIYWIPISWAVVTYFLIYRIASRSISRVESKNATFDAVRLKQTRLTKRVACLTGSMILFYGPLFITFLVIGCGKPCEIFVLLLFRWIRYSCSGVNPFLYALAVPGFRQEIRERFFRVREYRKKSALDPSSYDTSADASSDFKTLSKRKALCETPRREVLFDHFCTLCGKISENTVASKDARCQSCNRKFLCASWVLPSTWGTSCYFKCPNCPTIRYFDGVQPCYCQICNHKFRPMEKEVSERKYSVIQMSNSVKKPSQIISEDQVVGKNKALTENSDENESLNSSDGSPPALPAKSIPKVAVNDYVVPSNSLCLDKPEMRSSLQNLGSKSDVLKDAAGSQQKTRDIGKLRESVIRPLIERRSRLIAYTDVQILESGKQVEIDDGRLLQELDEIVAQFNFMFDLLNDNNPSHYNLNKS